MTILDRTGFFSFEVVGKWHGSKTEAQVLERMDACNREAAVIAEAASELITEHIESYRLRYTISAPRDVLTTFERAQSLCFVAKYDALPDLQKVEVNTSGKIFVPTNIDSFRHVLNEYRSIIQNQSDSTHYERIHSFCKQKLKNKDPSKDLAITVMDGETDEDITERFLIHLTQKKKAIAYLLKHCDFDYLYNGILQHADHDFTEQYIADYASGRLHYIMLKHAVICDAIRDLLRPHYAVLVHLSGVRMGYRSAWPASLQGRQRQLLRIPAKPSLWRCEP
jgi:hypothetical protein